MTSPNASWALYHPEFDRFVHYCRFDWMVPNVAQTSPSSTVPIADRLKAFAHTFDRHFDRFLQSAQEVPPRLLEAVRYAALGPGKRLRPYLAVRSAALVGGEACWNQAAAVECVHAFSLIHDDLPAMDNDDLRRGRPACHKQFDEPTAILAGDALLALAFELCVQGDFDQDRTGLLVAELARGTGWSGMIGGQMADIQAGHSAPSANQVESIHLRKTARLFETACRLGALAGGGSLVQTERLGLFGRGFGLVFQLVDDLLDLQSSPHKLGKNVKKDAAAGKQTYPACVGLDESKRIAHDLARQAIEAAAFFGEEADDLRDIVTQAIEQIS